MLVTLAPTPEDSAALLRTLEAFNAAGNEIAVGAYPEHSASKIDLQKLVYYAIRQRFGLSGQMTIRAIAKVAEADKRDKRVQPSLRPHGALVYDARICSLPGPDRVWLLTLDGRAEIPCRFGAYAVGMRTRKRGQADWLYRQQSDTFCLAVTVDAPEPEPGEPRPPAYLGGDRGVLTWAATSAGECLNHSAGPKHAPIHQGRARSSRFRSTRQQTGTKSATRLLKKRSGKERRGARDVKHGLSKASVWTAQGTRRGSAREDRTHIRARAGNTVGQRQRRVLHSWAFVQLRACRAYKAALAGVPVVYLNPAYTSQTCSRCGHGEQAHRQSHATFLWVACGFCAHADRTAAQNIRRAAVNRPDAAALAG